MRVLTHAAQRCYVVSCRSKMGLGFLFPVVGYFFIWLWSSLGLLRVLLAIIRHPFTALKKTAREIPPACLLDPSLGSHEYVTANGIKFHCVSAGDTSKPLMLLLHGFPEFWFSWRYQLREFSSDYHVVAVDMRGYGDTDRPEGKMSYTLYKLGQDISQLIPALGYSSCVLVAHDWGGAVAWRVADTNPGLINRLIILNCPHTSIMGEEISSTWKQLMKSWYIFMFQVPWLPEFSMGLHDYRNFNAIFRGRKAGVRNKASFPPDVVEAYKYTFSKPGALTGPINYIRAIYNTPEMLFPAEKKMIEIPTLIVWGDRDLFLEKGMADRHTSICTNLVVKHIPDCSHWVQQDAPDLCNQYISEFLARE